MPSRYRDFFFKLYFQKPSPVPWLTWFDDRLRLAVMKENRLYREFWDIYQKDKETLANDPGSSLVAFSDFCFELRFFGLDCMGIEILNQKWRDETLSVLNPYNEEDPPVLLPFNFFRTSPKGIHPIMLDNFQIKGGQLYSKSGFWEGRPWFAESSQRFLVLDLNVEKSVILKELSEYIDNEIKCCKQDGCLGQKTESRRKRDETWQQLKVWRLRRQRKSFLQIKQETGIKVDTAKKAFGRAYELIEGSRYDPKRYKELYKKIKTSELKHTCATCQDRDNCKEPCPDVLAYIDQDAVKLSELQL